VAGKRSISGKNRMSCIWQVGRSKCMVSDDFSEFTPSANDGFCGAPTTTVLQAGRRSGTLVGDRQMQDFDQIG